MKSMFLAVRACVCSATSSFARSATTSKRWRYWFLKNASASESRDCVVGLDEPQKLVAVVGALLLGTKTVTSEPLV